MRLEERRSELCHLYLHLATGQVKGGAPDGLRAATKGADSLLHDRRVAVMDRDVLDGNAELIGEHLREGRLVPLPMRRGSSRRGDPPVALDRDLRMLPPAGG